MNKKAWTQLEKLVQSCGAALRDRQQRSIDIWRGDMWAIIGAHNDLKKAREKANQRPTDDRER